MMRYQKRTTYAFITVLPLAIRPYLHSERDNDDGVFKVKQHYYERVLSNSTPTSTHSHSSLPNPTLPIYFPTHTHPPKIMTHPPPLTTLTKNNIPHTPTHPHPPKTMPHPPQCIQNKLHPLKTMPH